MPVKQDIIDAIEANDLELANMLYAKVRDLNEGKGLSGHDQQIFAHAFDQMRRNSDEPPSHPGPEPVVDEPAEPGDASVSGSDEEGSGEVEETAPKGRSRWRR